MHCEEICRVGVQDLHGTLGRVSSTPMYKGAFLKLTRARSSTCPARAHSSPRAGGNTAVSCLPLGPCPGLKGVAQAETAQYKALHTPGDVALPADITLGTASTWHHWQGADEKGRRKRGSPWSFVSRRRGQSGDPVAPPQSTCDREILLVEYHGKQCSTGQNPGKHRASPGNRHS